MYTAFTLDNGTCTEETDTSEHLRRDTSRISVEEVRVGLRDPNRDEHGHGRSEADQREGAQSSFAAACLTFGTNNGS